MTRRNRRSRAQRVQGCCGGTHDHSVHGHMTSEPTAKRALRDPSEGGTLIPRPAPRTGSTIAGETFLFGSAGCQNKFAARSAKKYLGQQQTQKPPTPEGTIYTCPCIRRSKVGTGSCTICGMALELEVASLMRLPIPTRGL